MTNALHCRRACCAAGAIFAFSAIVAAVSISFGAAPSTTPPNGLRDNTPRVHALTNARILVSPDKTIERGTLVIRDGVIEAVGADVKPPADARIWDCDGKTVYPGFVDAYSELGGDAPASGEAAGGGAAAARPRTAPGTPESGGAKYWNSKVTPELRIERLYKLDTDTNKKLRGQGFVARLVAPGRGIIKGISAVVTTADEEGNKAILKPAVAMHAQLTVPRGRRSRAVEQEAEDDSYPDSPMGAYTLVRQAIYDARWYGDAQAAWTKDTSLPRPEQNIALESLDNALKAKMPFVIDATDELYDLRVAAIAREFGLGAIIRGYGKEYRRVEAIAKTGHAVIVPVNFPKPPDVSTPEEAVEVSLTDLMDWDLAPENPARLASAGVKVAFTDQGLRDRSQFLRNVRKAVTRGMKREDALRALTVTPAALFGLDKTLGTLEKGKAASLVITDGDLFADRTKVLETWVDGNRYENGSLPLTDVRGTWTSTIKNAAGKDVAITLKIGGDLERLSGRLYLGEAPPATRPAASGPTSRPSNEVALANVSLLDARLGFTFKGDLIGRKGVVQVSATAADEDLSGSGVNPDGGTFAIAAHRTKHYSPADDPTTRRSRDGEDREDAGGDNAVAEVTEPEPPPPSEGSPGGTTRVATPTTRPTRIARAEGEGAGRASHATSRPVIKHALFEPNYPLGDFGRERQPDQPKQIVFDDATVWTSGPDGKIEHAQVVVVDGKISSVGPRSKAQWPAGTIVIDCAGKQILPGIIDCHSHIATDGGVNESGQAITAEVRIADFIDNTDINIYRQLAGGVTTSHILHGSANPIGGQDQVIKMRWGDLPEEMKFKDSPPGIKFALGENVKQSNWGDRYTSRYPQTRMGVEQITRDEFRAAQDYKRAWDTWIVKHVGIPPRRDLELDAIVEILDGKRLIHCHSYRQDEILALMRTCEEFGVRVNAFHHVLEGYKIADAIAKHGATATSFADWWAYKIEAFDAIPYNGALLYNAGVVTSFNSDDAELGRRLNLEAAKAVKYGGVPEVDALKFVTLNPAKQLHIEKWVGSIERGKDADLVVWNGSPLSTYSRVEQTWIDGRKFFDRDEDAKAREKTSDMRQQLVQRILQSGEAAAEPDDPDSRRVLWPDVDLFDE